MNLESWVEDLKKNHQRTDLSEDIFRGIEEHFFEDNPEIGGEIISDLLSSAPRMIPYKIYGGSIGWQSKKYFERWKMVLHRYSEGIGNDHSGVFVRFKINGKHWVDHPYAPPSFAIDNEKLFYSYICDSPEAYQLSKKWDTENSLKLTKLMRIRLRAYPTKVFAWYRNINDVDYAYVAFKFSEDSTKYISKSRIWKSQYRLYLLVRKVYPDVLYEFSPSWLGNQRLDMFIPSCNLAIEYNGIQHYKPISFFGGLNGFKLTVYRDDKKRKACLNNGIHLIEWKYTEHISELNFMNKLKLHNLI